jgi:hypothetical protein
MNTAEISAMRRAGLVLLLMVPAPIAAAPEQPPALEGVRTSSPPRIDALLDEPVWQTAAVIDDFTMQLPRDGVPASERTEVRLLYDDENLYLGITCFDANPAAIRISSLLRDEFAVSDGEQLAFAIDSSDSGRDGFWFSTNPGGAQLDSQIFDEGRIFDPQWDGVWTSTARIHEQGWTVEIQLPFYNLRFVEAPVNTMRINFFRAIRHRNEEDYSPAIPRNYAGTMSFSIGRPVLFRGIRRGSRLDLKPYGLVSAASSYETAPDSDLTGEAGLDAKWGPTPNLTADFTIRPDFAQVEADDFQINLTRFPLFFPEKREFFLESAGLFAFGLPQETSAFHSRRIGLDAEGRPIPIRAGARLTGRTAGWSLGVLDAVTEPTDGSPQTNFFVGRLRRDVGRRSTVGAILAEREASGAGGGNRVAGADTRLVFGEDAYLEAFAMGSQGSGPGGDGYASDAGWSRQGDRWRYGGYAGIVDAGFDPGIGFVVRPGIQYTGGFLAFRPRPASFPSVRQFEFQVDERYVEARGIDPDLDGGILDRSHLFRFRTELERGDSFGAWYHRLFERIPGDFEIARGVVIPAGDYESERIEASFQTWTARPLALSGFVNTGTFFDGRRRVFGGGVTARFSHHLRVATQYVHNQVRIPFGDFDTRLWITRVSYAFTPALFGGALVQWNDVTDDLDLNLRLDFIYRPGSDLFLVYNESFNTDRAAGEPRSNRRAGVMKLTYLLRF